MTVVANNKSRPQGKANPPLTATYSGFVNGESLANSDIAGDPSLATDATTDSAAGAYPIKATTGTLNSVNYNFVFVDGTLDVIATNSAPIQQASIALVAPPSGEAIKVNLSGAPSQVYVIEASTDLVHWTAISTNTTDVSGTLTVTDPDAKNYSCRFYRSVAQAQ